MRDRTADLLDANQALSQLSYSPIACFCYPASGAAILRKSHPEATLFRLFTAFFLSCFCDRKLVGLGGFEPPTSPLSGVRSNQLSYRPELAPGSRIAKQCPCEARVTQTC